MGEARQLGLIDGWVVLIRRRPALPLEYGVYGSVQPLKCQGLCGSAPLMTVMLKLAPNDHADRALAVSVINVTQC